jgi:uncharacterized membrane protein
MANAIAEHPAQAREAFTHEALERVGHMIADVEQATHAEIRISIRDVREASEADLSLKELAEKEFAALGMHYTDGRTGILLMILYHEKKFYVIGDEGVHSRVHPETWNDIARTLAAHFKNAEYEQGLHEALRKIEHHLKGKLPNRKSENSQHDDEIVMK